jgi:hypothetical protein
MEQVRKNLIKPFKNFLLVFAIVVSSSHSRPSENFEGTIFNSNKPFGSQAMLKYVGTTSGFLNLSIGIQVAIDTTIGFRYEIAFQNGTHALSHIAIFYKFSQPDQSIVYDFLTHKSTVNKDTWSPDSDANVDVIGTETLGKYSCTHLQQRVRTEEINDYWMCASLPGFQQLVLKLLASNELLPALAFSGTIFRWGGLVKMSHNFVDPKTGDTQKVEIHLQEANKDVNLSSKTFDAPSK